MPDQPTWYRRMPEIERQLAAWPDPWLDRAAVERLLGIGRRRAQQILAGAGAGAGHAGRSALVTPAQMAEYLAERPAGPVERERRRAARFAAQLRAWEQAPPRLLVAAGVAVTGTMVAGLPEGVSLGPGRIEVRFRLIEEAAEKMLALAMALANDPETFERETRPASATVRVFRAGEGIA